MQESDLKNHSVWQLLSQANEALEQYPEDQQRTAQYSEAREKIEYVRWTLEQSDPSLLTRAELDQVQGHLQNIVNHINQQTNQAQRLAQVDQWFAPIVDKFPYPRVRKLFRSERTEILNEFEQEILRLREEAGEFFDSVQASQETLTADIDASRKRTNEASREISSLEARVNVEFEKWEARASQQISERLAELSSEFSNDQAARKSEHQKELDELSIKMREIESERDGAKTELNSTLEKIRKDAEAERRQIIEDGDQFLEKIKGIYQISGQTALAGDFENAAQAESKIGRNFSILSAIFFVIAPTFFVYQWSQIDLNGVDPLGLMLKLSAALAFLIPAAYFGNTSRRHHRVSTALRALGIKVATFDAYLANFPDEERNRIKEQMAEMFFAAQISPDQLGRIGAKDAERALGMLDNLRGLVSKS